MHGSIIPRNWFRGSSYATADNGGFPRGFVSEKETHYFNRKNQRNFEEEVCIRSSLDDVGREVLARCKAFLETDISDEQLLRSRGFLVNSYLTNVGILLFSRIPQDSSRVRECAFFDYRMEVRSLGKPPNIVTLDNMRNIRHSCNPDIARVLAEMAWLLGACSFGMAPRQTIHLRSTPFPNNGAERSNDGVRGDWASCRSIYFVKFARREQGASMGSVNKLSRRKLEPQVATSHGGKL